MSNQTYEISITIPEQHSIDLLRFYETTEDGQDYDVPAERMKAIAQDGYIRSTGFSRYEFTSLGLLIVERLRARIGFKDEPGATPGEGFYVIEFCETRSSQGVRCARVSTPSKLLQPTPTMFWCDVARFSLTAVLLAHSILKGTKEVPVDDLIQSLSDLDNLCCVISSIRTNVPEATAEIAWLECYLKFWHGDREQESLAVMYRALNQGLVARLSERPVAA